MNAVHQFVPKLEPGAIGAHALEIQKSLRARGHESEIFTEHLAAAHYGYAHHFNSYRSHARPGDMLLLHMAIGSTVAQFVLDRSEPVIVDYHNITPPDFFAPWEPGVLRGLRWGEVQLARLAGRAVAGWGDSAFNESDLVRLGYRRTRVVPILFDPSSFEREVDATRLGRLEAARESGGSDWLFVGRLAPNKAQHDLVKALAAYRRAFDPNARLHLVGGASSHSYLTALEKFVAELGLSEAVDITGSVSAGELSAHYRAADVFVCASEHEGFCVPLLEAMHHRLPIVAFGAAAVPETLDGAGLVLFSKAPAVFAAAVGRVVGDEGLRARLVSAGEARLQEFSLERSRACLAAAIDEALGPQR